MATIIKARPDVTVAEAERTAMLDDPSRPWRGVRFEDSPIGATRSVIAGTSFTDEGVVNTSTKEVRDRQNYQIARPERIKGGNLLPPDPVSVFDAPDQAATCAARYARLGREQGLPGASYLETYAQVASYAEYMQMTAGVAEDLDRAARDDTLAAAEREAAEAQERLEQARAAAGAEAPTPEPAVTDQWQAATDDDGNAIKGVRVRRKADNSLAWKARVGQTNSPTFGSLAEAIAWRTEAEAS